MTEQMNVDTVPMSYYRVFRDVRDVVPRDAIIVRCLATASSASLAFSVLGIGVWLSL